MSLIIIATIGLAAIVVARRARRRQRALDSLRWPE